MRNNMKIRLWIARLLAHGLHDQDRYKIASSVWKPCKRGIFIGEDAVTLTWDTNVLYGHRVHGADIGLKASKDGVVKTVFGGTDPSERSVEATPYVFGNVFFNAKEPTNFDCAPLR